MGTSARRTEPSGDDVDIYEKEDDVDMEALDEWIETERRFEVADVTTRQNGRTRLVEASIRTSLSEFRQFFGY